MSQNIAHVSATRLHNNSCFHNLLNIIQHARKLFLPLHTNNVKEVLFNMALLNQNTLHPIRNTRVNRVRLDEYRAFFSNSRRTYFHHTTIDPTPQFFNSFVELTLRSCTNVAG